MSASVTSVKTASASRYLQQLCKHWGHRFVVSFTPEEGSIDFGDGKTVALQAQDGVLALRVETGQADDLSSLERVVEDHLKRFAFREELSFAWAPEISGTENSAS